MWRLHTRVGVSEAGDGGRRRSMTRAQPAAPRACVAAPTAVRGPILTKYKYFAFTLIPSIYIDETAIFLAIDRRNERSGETRRRNMRERESGVAPRSEKLCRSAYRQSQSATPLRITPSLRSAPVDRQTKSGTKFPLLTSSVNGEFWLWRTVRVCSANSGPHKHPPPPAAVVSSSTVVYSRCTRHTIGPWDPSAHQLLKDFHNCLVDNWRPKGRQLLSQKTSTVVQRGNAASLLSTMIRGPSSTPVSASAARRSPGAEAAVPPGGVARGRRASCRGQVTPATPQQATESADFTSRRGSVDSKDAPTPTSQLPLTYIGGARTHSQLAHTAGIMGIMCQPCGWIALLEINALDILKGTCNACAEASLAMVQVCVAHGRNGPRGRRAPLATEPYRRALAGCGISMTNIIVYNIPEHAVVKYFYNIQADISTVAAKVSKRVGPGSIKLSLRAGASLQMSRLKHASAPNRGESNITTRIVPTMRCGGMRKTFPVVKKKVRLGTLCPSRRLGPELVLAGRRAKCSGAPTAVETGDIISWSRVQNIFHRMRFQLSSVTKTSLIVFFSSSFFLGVVTIIKLLYVEALPKLRSVIPGMQAYSWAHTFIDNLFDSMNGSYKNSRNRSGKPLLQALKPNSPHKDVWRQAKPKLNSMQFVTSDGKACNVPSIQNWLRTIENMKYLRDKLYRLSQKYHVTVTPEWRALGEAYVQQFFG
ncbi:hypothetical protein MSG28_006981 [Choristoneura fumiferana]|uniref:Uncharacterized protein n=1 Tax=Choristoneura fumiferana TaxID=7141 RepID=A0ACC0JLX2_CHOFU|nr:hypothetical protein MSG28_006981 [Choristoneura fumiferana]